MMTVAYYSRATCTGHSINHMFNSISTHSCDINLLNSELGDDDTLINKSAEFTDEVGMKQIQATLLSTLIFIWTLTRF